ncbi:acetate--CoA ligase family protein [Streptomyces sp. NPDC051940]|uniref:acetate--CoA ligase family protein n=1 Tax=Streptomyces sp. NPDC051940 TaxID=3155675 RepID=UPI003417D1A6
MSDAPQDVRMSGAPLDVLFAPSSVAVVGASADPAKWGYWLAKGALAGRDRRQVHLVNRKGGELDGVPFSASLPPAEHVVVSVPAPAVEAVVRDGLAAGARCFTVITSGADGRRLAELAAAGGARLLGPNCMGVVDTSAGLRLSWGDFPAGAVGMVSQSGNLGLEVGRLLARAGEGFSRFVSLGDQRDIDAAEAVESLVAHEQTRVIALYVEDFRDGRRLTRVLSAARAAGKPVLLLTVGGSAASQRAAASHTGALVSARAVVAAACDAAGALLLRSAGELADAAVALMGEVRRNSSEARRNSSDVRRNSSDVRRNSSEAHREPAPLRVAVVADSGGQGALAADDCVRHGLDVPPLSAPTVSSLAALLPSAAGTGNPVDLAGAGEADLRSYARVARTLLASPDTDAVVLTGYFGDYATGNPAQRAEECAVAEELASAARDSGKPLLVHTMARDTPALAVLRTGGVPVHERIEQTTAALSAVARLRAGEHRLPVLPLPRPSGPRATDGGYEATRELLASYGLSFPPAAFVTSAEEAAFEADAVGYPVALKAMGLAHKTEAGGVALQLADGHAVRTAFARMRERTGAARYCVEAMATPPYAVELIVGVRHDPSFGPAVMTGIGGVTAELLADTRVALAPVSPAQARELLLGLEHAPLLRGWRGAPPVSLEAAAAAVCAIARAAAEHPELAELEVNPLLVHPGGAVALDAHAVPA